MRFVSLCSGVEATTVAWSRLGWRPLAYAEVEPFACAVLANRMPDVPNLGDVRNIDWKEFHEQNGIIDVLFASTPCQSFSIAGNRLGLDGESGLMLEFIRAVRELVGASGGESPRYLVWENVPGCLSSGPKGAKGSDFRCLLETLVECGFGLSWRVLDSQFARVHDGQGGGFRGPVAQRRRRVYLVGTLGTDGSGEILFERESMRGNHPKGRAAREALAEHLDESAQGNHRERERVTCLGSVRQHAPIEDDLAGTLDAGHEQPIVVIDRAAFNQGKNAQYPPHIEETSLMDTLVARGPHALCYRTGTK